MKGCLRYNSVKVTIKHQAKGREWEMIREDVLAAYRLTESIKGAARKCGVSEVVVRKVLIGEGLHTSPRVERIRELTAAGMPPKDICELLGVSDSCVNGNMPYVKGTHLNPNKSVNALRIRACRERKKCQHDAGSNT